MKRLQLESAQDVTSSHVGVPVELPGIEPGEKMMLTCRNAEFDDAKTRETT